VVYDFLLKEKFNFKKIRCGLRFLQLGILIFF
jgi:hypothetical protein